MKYLLLQTPAGTTEPLPDQAINILDLLVKGGPVMIPIAILSIITVYLWIERYITIRKASKMDNSFMDNIRDQVLNGNIKAAKALCEKTDTPIARMLSKGIHRIGKPLKNN
jgi:biopolymer transport protein ExbB